MKQVTHDEFYEFIWASNVNIVSEVQGRFPHFTSIFKYTNGDVVGKIEGHNNPTYWLN